MALLNKNFRYEINHFYNPSNCAIIICGRSKRQPLIAQKEISVQGRKTPVSLRNNKKLKALSSFSAKQCKQVKR